uniref:Failed axon connections n=1 Tax=Meloidogyne floridensis TaxID=298350 RepID=A0A915P0D5_9BILA
MQYIKAIEGEMLKPTRGLLVRNWTEDVVNLVQYPRTHSVVNASPFCVKLETWLRITGIKHKNTDNEMTKASSKGQLPFIELNGRQFADSNFIIDHLKSHFKLTIDENLSDREKADARAYTILIEESLFRCLMYDRAKSFGWLATDKGILPLQALQKFVFQKILLKQLEKRLKNALHAQGYGRHSPEEIEEIAKKDLTALSTLLGEKSFMFGDIPSTLDATAFGLLVQFTDAPMTSDKIKTFMEQNTPNLIEFVKRLKERYWPDWTQLCETLALNPEDIKKEEEQKKEENKETENAETPTAAVQQPTETAAAVPTQA